MDETFAMLADIRERLKSVETKIDEMTGIKTDLKSTYELARDADDRSRSNKHRLDKIDKIIGWFVATTGGGVLLAIVAFILRGGLSK